MKKNKLQALDYVADCFAVEEFDLAINKTLKFLRRYFNVDIVSVRTTISRDYCLRFVLESVKSTISERRINETIVYTKEQWEDVINLYKKGNFLSYNQENIDVIPGLKGKNIKKAFLQVPMFFRGSFIGTMDFVNVLEDKIWTEEEIYEAEKVSNLVCTYYGTSNLYSENMTDYSIDPLTGLKNYESFVNSLEKLISNQSDDKCIGIVYSDIYHFKYINETYGYNVGNNILKLAAAVIKENSDDTVTACRVHSDNFVISMLIDKSQERYFTEQIKIISRIFITRLQESYPEIQLKTHSGIYFIENPNVTAEIAVANANLARKILKKDDTSSVKVFKKEMMDDISTQEHLCNELPKAIKNRNLKVYYQPKISCGNEELVGAEALIRWVCDDGTFIYPDQFIPTFEKNGNILDVDYYVYEDVFKYIYERIENGLPCVPISMNVSRVHFNDDKLINYVKFLFGKYPIPSHLIEFELTENIYMANFDNAAKLLEACHSLDILVSMDDFGSGYSSLNMISELTIDILKIDKIFLKHDVLTENDKVIIETIVKMAKSLNIKVLCEGVETLDQSKFLREIGCDLMQGYYYSKPLSQENFDEYIKKKLVK